MSSSRVALVTNYCPHYRVQLFKELATRVDLTLILTTRGNEWYWEGERPMDTGGVRASHASTVPAIVGELRRGRYDAVITTLAGRASLLATIITTRALGIPLVTWVGMWEHPRTLAHRVSHPATRWLYRSSDAVVTYGTHISEFVARESGRTSNVFIARQAVDNDHFRRPVSEAALRAMRSRFGSEDLPTFTFVGRLTEEKGLDYLVDASAKSVVPHRVAIAGRGPLFDETQKLVKSRSIEDRFRFLGYVGQDELPALLNASDGLVLPSISTTRWKEPWGLVVNEAMNASLPVIATDAVGAAAGGLLVHDKTGLVVPQKDSDSLAAAIDALAADPEKRRRLGDAASARVLEWNHIAQADGFEQALAAARVRTRTTAGSAWPVNAEAAAGPGDTIG